MANIDDTYSNPSKEYEVAIRRLMSMRVSSAAAKKIWNNLLVFHMLIFNTPLRATSLTLIYPAHSDNVQCQYGVKYNYLW